MRRTLLVSAFPAAVIAALWLRLEEPRDHAARAAVVAALALAPSLVRPLAARVAGAVVAVLLAAICGLLFDGVELGLMPIASLSVSQELLGPAFTPTLGGAWFARFTAALMLGAATGGILLGSLLLDRPNSRQCVLGGGWPVPLV